MIMQFLIGICLAFSLLLSMVLLPLAHGESTGSIAINIFYTNGDRADYSTISLKIYQDYGQNPFLQIDSISGNPFNIVSLPLVHQYRIDVYSNGMFETWAYVDLQQTQQTLDIKVPLPGGMRVNVLYNDKLTPIVGATVSIMSKDNKTWFTGIADDKGQTLRTWISPTIAQNDYYIVNIKIGQHLFYTTFPIFLSPGVPQEVKIAAPWPPLVNNLIMVKVYNNQSKPVSYSDGTFVVDLYGYTRNKISESPVNNKGEAYFYNLKVGDYILTVINQNNKSKWGEQKIALDGTKLVFSIMKNQTGVVTQKITSPKTVQMLKISCNCVAFRLDNIQDYWLDNVQVKIIDTFEKKNAPITIGIIAKVFGSDLMLTDYLKTETNNNRKSIDIGINGWSFEDFTSYNETRQASFLYQSKARIHSVLGISSSVFIPPYSKANQDTLYAMNDTGIRYLSPNSDIALPTTILGKIQSVPATVFTGYSYPKNGRLQYSTNDELVSEIQTSVKNNGFAVVELNFQDFAENNGTKKVNAPDRSEIATLSALIDKVRSSGFQIVTISGIENQSNNTNAIPSWIKNYADSWSNNEISNSKNVRGHNKP